MNAAGVPLTPAAALRVGIVAAEHSGDQLGAALIGALRARVPQLICFGVAGPKMIAAGCEPWGRADELGVMGLAEVLRHLPRLLKLRAALRERLLSARPDVFIGVDAPEFNLGLARHLKRAGIPAELHIYAQTAHDFGVRASDRPCSAWTQSCASWLRHQGLLEPSTRP